MHLNATAKPSTEGTTPIQRQRAAPIAPTRKSNHDGSNQNHSAKKEAPTASEATVASHCFPGFVICEAPPLIVSPVAANGESATESLASFTFASNTSYVRHQRRLHFLFVRLAEYCTKTSLAQENAPNVSATWWLVGLPEVWTVLPVRRLPGTVRTILALSFNKIKKTTSQSQ